MSYEKDSFRLVLSFLSISSKYITQNIWQKTKDNRLGKIHTVGTDMRSKGLLLSHTFSS